MIIAFTAERHVHVGTANKLLRRPLAGAERVVGVRRANLADGRQLLDLLAERNQLQDVLPAFLLVCAIERRQNDNLASVRCRLGKFNNLYKMKNEA